MSLVLKAAGEGQLHNLATSIGLAATGNSVILKLTPAAASQTVANKKLTSGTVFTVINNTAASAISGTFANLPDGSTLTAGPNKLLVSYTGGDGNDLTLTVQ